MYSLYCKIEVCISYGSKVIAKVKVDKKQTGQKQYGPDLRMRGHKNGLCSVTLLLLLIHELILGVRCDLIIFPIVVIV